MMRDILFYIKSLIAGHFTVFKHSFKPAVTVEYPDEKPIIPDRFRGKHTFDENACIGCKTCMRVCPASAVEIFKDGNKKTILFDYKKCIFCGNCKYYCPKSAIGMSKQYELATDKVEDLKIEMGKKDNE